MSFVITSKDEKKLDAALYFIRALLYQRMPPNTHDELMKKYNLERS